MDTVAPRTIQPSVHLRRIMTIDTGIVLPRFTLALLVAFASFGSTQETQFFVWLKQLERYPDDQQL